MGCTVEELGQRITSSEMTYWLAYYELEPWGCEADDQRAALICKFIFDAFRPRNDGKPWDLQDFMLNRNPKTMVKRPDKISAEDLLESLKLITAVLQEVEKGKNGG